MDLPIHPGAARAAAQIYRERELRGAAGDGTKGLEDLDRESAAATPGESPAVRRSGGLSLSAQAALSRRERLLQDAAKARRSLRSMRRGSGRSRDRSSSSN